MLTAITYFWPGLPLPSFGLAYHRWLNFDLLWVEFLDLVVMSPRTVEHSRWPPDAARLLKL